MQTHLINGQSTTIVYVRGIPVFSFVGDGPAPVQPNTAASQPAAEPTVQPAPPAASTEAKSAIPQEASAKGAETLLAQTIATETKPAAPQVSEQTSDDRAMAIAAQLNQLYRNNVDASTIVAVWDEPSQSYLVKVGDTVLAVVDPNTRLADTTNSPEQDALQIANRLRRLLGNAEPLTAVEGAPARDTRIAVGPIEFTVKGYASWYGPGFHGNMSASGEIFNENAMTAAHRELPFGTLVRVTNLDTGLAIVVRINDRGPFYGNRVIDLSAAAADAIGLMSSGVAPVQLDVLGTTASN
jgi:rare lipoprotein A